MNLMKCFVVPFFMATTLFADGFIIFPPPYLTPLSVKYHKVNCDINNGVATTTIDQVFVNNNEVKVSGGHYVFPVPKGAAIDEFKVVVDGVAKVATVMKKEEARLFFTNAVKNSNQASLLEYTNNSAYSLEIGSVEAGASRRLQISYVEVLPKNEGISKYLYPLNTEKFSMKLIDTVSITVNISNATPITSVYSPSFPVTIQRIDDKTVTANYTCVKSRPNRDFDLYYKLSDDDISFHLFTSKQDNEDGFFLMLITPKVQKPSEGDQVAAKDIVFTIDKSGSMAGTKITQARDALRFCVNRLLPDDYFNIVAFESTVSSNANELLPATIDNISAIREYVNAIASGGGTNISGALTTTLSRMGPTQRPHYCIFLTDGQATAGETNSAKISLMVNEANTSGTRIFSVGFGFNVNTVLIDKISLDNGGFPLYCSPDQNIEEVIGDLYKRIESPILTSPSIAFEGPVSLYSISPEKLPDLFSGSEIAVYGRYKGQGTNIVTLSGNNGKEVVSMTFTADFPSSNSDYAFVPRLWATQQIANLMTKIKMQVITKESSALLVDSVKTLSLEYGIVTPYTSSLFISGGSSISIVEGLQEASGSKANSTSNYMQGMQQNSNAAQTLVADTNSLPYTIAPQVNQMQNVGNKIFVYTADSIWKDVAYDSVSASDTIFYGSDKFFTLASSSDELQELLAVGNQTAFNFKGQNYLVLDVGTSAILPPDVKAGTLANVQTIGITVVSASISISRSRSEIPGAVEIYSISGKRITHIFFGESNTVVFRPEQGRHRAGTYLAVYREPGLEQVKKFVIQ